MAFTKRGPDTKKKVATNKKPLKLFINFLYNDFTFILLNRRKVSEKLCMEQLSTNNPHRSTGMPRYSCAVEIFVSPFYFIFRSMSEI